MGSFQSCSEALLDHHGSQSCSRLPPALNPHKSRLIFLQEGMQHAVDVWSGGRTFIHSPSFIRSLTMCRIFSVCFTLCLTWWGERRGAVPAVMTTPNEGASSEVGTPPPGPALQLGTLQGWERGEGGRLAWPGLRWERKYLLLSLLPGQCLGH